MSFVYAVAQLKGGGVQFEVMSRAEIEEVRKTSKAGQSGPWSSHWEEMAKKTVIRRLFKYLPVSIEAVRAVEADEKADRGEVVTPSDVFDSTLVDKGEAPEEPIDWDSVEPAKAQRIGGAALCRSVTGGVGASAAPSTYHGGKPLLNPRGLNDRTKGKYPNH